MERLRFKSGTPPLPLLLILRQADSAVRDNFDRDPFGEKRARRRRAALLGLHVRCFGQLPREGLSGELLVGVKLNFDAINGRAETSFDRWHSRHLVPALVLLHPPSYQSLCKLRSSRASPRASLLCALSPPMVRLVTRLTRNGP